MHNQKLFFVLLSSLILLAACGGGGETAAPAETTPGPAETLKTVDTASTGSITGNVSYSGQPSRGARIRMNADPTCNEQHSGPVYASVLQVNDEGRLENAFVWVKQGLEDYQFETPSEAKVLDQKGCLYEPRVLGVQVKQKIQILNSDPTTHNIHPIPSQNREWNKSQPPSATPLVESFARQEVMIAIKCNIHPWMKAYVGVIPHPYFAVTGQEGTFDLKDLPPGEYTLEAWHEKLGTQEQKVTVTPNEKTGIEFAFSG